MNDPTSSFTFETSVVGTTISQNSNNDGGHRPQQQQQQLLQQHQDRINRQQKGRCRRSSDVGRRGRLWQLPQSSIEEYAAWIEQKPNETQTPAEQRFLHKYQRRKYLRQEKPHAETMKQYIARLEAKDNPSDVEIQLIERYHRRKAHKRRRLLRNNPFRGSIIPSTISWSREPRKKGSTSAGGSTMTTGVLTNMAHLQESMNRMGLSADRLRDIPMEDTTPGLDASFQTETYFP